MFHLFRKIRFKLISQDILKKYLMYALGEILLVVIGILIAMQVNNWNENRKNETAKDIIIESIKEDLTSDVIYLNSYIQQTNLEYSTLVSDRIRISQKGFTKDSLIQYAKQDIDVFMTNFIGFNNNAYTSFKTSGNANLIGDPLKKELYELSILQVKVEEIYKSYRDFYFESIRKLSDKYPVPTPFTFMKEGDMSAIIWDNIDEKDLALQINSWGTAKANFYSSNIADFTEVLEKTESILEMM